MVSKLIVCVFIFQDAAVSARKAELSRKRAEDIAAGTVQMNGRELFLHEPWVFDNSQYWGFFWHIKALCDHALETLILGSKYFSVAMYFWNMKFEPLAKKRKQWKVCFYIWSEWICFMLKTVNYEKLEHYKLLFIQRWISSLILGIST